MLCPLFCEEFNLLALQDVLDIFEGVAEKPFHVGSRFAFKILLVHLSFDIVEHEGTNKSGDEVTMRPMTRKHPEDLHLTVNYHEHAVLTAQVGRCGRLRPLPLRAYEVHVVVQYRFHIFAAKMEVDLLTFQNRFVHEEEDTVHLIFLPFFVGVFLPRCHEDVRFVGEAHLVQ